MNHAVSCWVARGSAFTHSIRFCCRNKPRSLLPQPLPLLRPLPGAPALSRAPLHASRELASSSATPWRTFLDLTVYGSSAQGAAGPAQPEVGEHLSASLNLPPATSTWRKLGRRLGPTRRTSCVRLTCPRLPTTLSTPEASSLPSQTFPTHLPTFEALPNSKGGVRGPRYGELRTRPFAGSRLRGLQVLASFYSCDWGAG